MRGMDPGVLLERSAGIVGFECDLGAADTGAVGTVDQHGPTGATALGEGAVEFGHELGINHDVTHIEVITWCGLHDVMERHCFGPKVFGKRAVDHVE